MKVRDKFKFGSTSLTRLATVDEDLQKCAKKAIMCSPVDFGVPWMGGYRTAEEQKSIYDKGYSRADGTTAVSYHQSGMALDLVPFIQGTGFDYEAHGRFGIIGMLMLEAWEELQDEGEIDKNRYLHWGGFWRNRTSRSLGWDMAHFEIRHVEQVERLS